MEKVKLGDISKLINGDRGKNYPSQADITDEGEIPFVNAGHLNGRNIDFSEMNYISQDKYDKLSSGKFQRGDILYCLRGSLGKKAIVNNDVNGAIASSLVIIRPNMEKVSGEYLMLALDSPAIKEQLVKANNGSSQPNLSAASVREYDIELPELTVQKEVVEKLIKVRNVIDNRQKELLMLDDLIKARFVELFRNCNEYERLGEADIFISDGNYSSKYPTADEFVEYGIPFIRASNMVDNTISDDEMYYISADKHSELLKGHVKPFDILIATRGAGIGKIAVVPERHNDSNINAQIVLLRCNTNVYNPLYLSWYMKLQDTQMKIQGLISGSAQPQLPIKRLVQLDLLRPEIEKQNEFADFVKQVDKSKVAVQKALEESKLLFDSLMQEYFG